MSSRDKDPSNYDRRTPDELVVAHAELIVGIEALRAAGVSGLETKKNLGSNYIRRRNTGNETGKQEKDNE